MSELFDREQYLRTDEPFEWKRTPGLNVPAHCTFELRGWVIRHCGHPTAHFPWMIHDPEGRSHGTRMHVADAKRYVANHLELK